TGAYPRPAYEARLFRIPEGLRKWPLDAHDGRYHRPFAPTHHHQGPDRRDHRSRKGCAAGGGLISAAGPLAGLRLRKKNKRADEWRHPVKISGSMRIASGIPFMKWRRSVRALLAAAIARR